MPEKCAPIQVSDKNLAFKVQQLSNWIGNLSNLSTTDKSNLVAAINEVYDMINGNAVFDPRIGDMNNLTTNHKTFLVNALNEVNTKIGELGDLDTQDTSSIVNAINSLKNAIDQVGISISQIEQDIQNNLNAISQNAINISDLDGRVTTAESDIDKNESDISTLDGKLDGIISRAEGQANDISELQDQVSVNEDNIGDLNELETANKDSLVDAINEANQNGGGTPVEEQYSLNIDDYSIENVMYKGEAEPGSLDSEPKWRIEKIDETTGIVTSFPSGDDSFAFIWDDRLTLFGDA
jgi:DNA repair ATPase RecN